MTKYLVRFRGYPEDLLSALRISANRFIRKTFGWDKSKVQRIPLVIDLDDVATPERLQAVILRSAAVVIWQMSGQGKSFNEIVDEVWAAHRQDIDRWVEENRDLIAEIVLLGDGRGRP